SGTPIWINVTDNGTNPCLAESVHLYYRIWYNGEWSDIYHRYVPSGTLTEEIHLSGNCTHYLEFYVEDDLGNRYPTCGWHNETFYLDEQPPNTVKTVGTPQCGDGYWVTTNTKISLDAHDLPEQCGVGIREIHYRIAWDENQNNVFEPGEYSSWMTVYSDHVEFNFTEECYHKIEWYAVDKFNHTEETKSQFHRVDDTPPEIIKIVGEPSFTDDNETWWVTTDTEINLSAVDHEEPCAVGLDKIEYRIWYMGNWSDWIEYTGNFTFSEGCTHYLEVKASDCLGNYALDNETFIVHGPSGSLNPPTLLEPVDGAYIGYKPVLRWNQVDGATDYILELDDNIDFLSPLVSTITDETSYDTSWDSLEDNVPYYWHVAARDNNGVPGQWSDTWWFKIDTEPPDDFNINTYGLVSGVIQYNVSDLDASDVEKVVFEIKPTGEPRITFAIDYNPPYSGILDTTEYEDGNYRVYVTAYDYFGHSTPSTPSYDGITIDNTPPDIEITSPSGGTIVSGIVDIEFTGYESDNPIVLIDGNEYVSDGSPYEWDTTMEYDGTHSIQIKDTDEAGNTGYSDPIMVLVDNYDESDPHIWITYPEQGSTQNNRTLEVKIHAYDDMTSWENLDVKLWIPGGGDVPTLWYDVQLDETEDYYVAYIDIYKYQNGAELTLCADATDEAGNYQPAQPVTFTVESTIVWDQWMQNGWNQLILPPDGIACSSLVENVLASIDGCYDWVFYYNPETGLWDNYEYGGGGNSLTEMETGKIYWIHMNNTETRFYTDTNYPYIEITIPDEENMVLNSLNEINGTAHDIETTVTDVSIQIFYEEENTSYYWNGTAWVEEPTDLSCNLETNVYIQHWQYNSSDVEWINGEIFNIIATATDKAGCHAYNITSFLYDNQPPYVEILDPMDGEIKEDMQNINIYAHDWESNVTEVYAQIYDQNTGLYYNGTTWQGNPEWLLCSYEDMDEWTFDTSGIWTNGHNYSITAVAYDIPGNMGGDTNMFTIDRGSPLIIITYPIDGSTINCMLSMIEGNASDNETSVAYVYIQIYDHYGNGSYWNGSGWQKNQVNLTCSYNNILKTWEYNSTLVNWIDMHNYTIYATAVDNAGNIAQDQVFFYFICEEKTA
ncbi:MAG: hypothetical protein DRN08_01425, partial [Thermoplasmata archaeon]